MHLSVLGLDIEVRKQAPVMSPVADNRGWWPLVVKEPFGGAWQKNIAWSADSVLAYHAVFACVTLIASDIAKLRAKLVQQDANGIWSETKSAAFSPVLRKPNHYQNHIQFRESWMLSKLKTGNTYVMKERDNRGGELQGVVRALYILDPLRVTPLVAPDGSIFYKVGQDNLSGLEDVDYTFPASEIIHDRMNTVFHHLVGISPLFAAGPAATVGQQAENNSSKFFANDNTPTGILTAPGTITQQQATELSERWQARAKGKVAVLGNGLTFEQLRMSADDAQMIEMMQHTAVSVCQAFHVPPFKIGAGTPATYQNGEILNQIYYSDCLQYHIESMELALDEGLGLTEPKEGRQLGVELELDTLLRMDTATQIKTLTEGIKGSLYTPDEARSRVDLKPLPGGDTVYMQQQNFSLAALAERDQDSPFAKPAEPAEPAPATEVPGATLDPEAEKQLSVGDALALVRKELRAA